MATNKKKRFKRRPKLIQAQFKWYVLSLTLTGAALSVNEFFIGIVVSNLLGAAALAVVALALPVYVACCACAAFIGDGFGVLYGQAIGKARQDEAKRIFSSAMLLAVFISILTSAGSLLFLPEFSRMLANGDARQAANLAGYLRCLMPGLPLVLLLSVLSKFITQNGEPKTASLLLLLANVATIVAAYLLIAVWGWGIEGAALAIGAGYASTLVPLAWGLKKRAIQGLGLVWVSWRDIWALRHSVFVGCSGGLQFVWVLLQIYGMNALAWRGADIDGVILNAVCLGLNSLMSVVGGGIAETMVPMFSVMQGARDVRAQRFILWRSYLLMLIFPGAITLLAFLFPQGVFWLYGVQSDELFTQGAEVVRINVLGMYLLCVILCFQLHQVLLKHPVFTNVVSFMKSFGIVIPLGWLFVRWYGYIGLWYAYLAGSVVSLTAVLLFNAYLVHASKGALQGPFLLPRPDESKTLDFSVDCRDQDAVLALSHEIIGWTDCFNLDKRTRILIGLAVEEMGMLFHAQTENKPHTMDVILYRTDSGVEVVFRDIGRPVNIIVLDDERPQLFSGIQMLEMISRRKSYARMMMMNHHSFLLQEKPPEESSLPGMA